APLFDGLHQRLGGQAIDVDERHPGALRTQVLDDRGADAAAATGDKRDARFETGIRGDSDHETLQVDHGPYHSCAPAAPGSCWRLPRARYDELGCGIFHTTGMELSPDECDRHRMGADPWHAMQRAPWEALKAADA